LKNILFWTSKGGKCPLLPSPADAHAHDKKGWPKCVNDCSFFVHAWFIITRTSIAVAFRKRSDWGSVSTCLQLSVLSPCHSLRMDIMMVFQIIQTKKFPLHMILKLLLVCRKNKESQMNDQTLKDFVSKDQQSSLGLFYLVLLTTKSCSLKNHQNLQCSTCSIGQGNPVLPYRTDKKWVHYRSPFLFVFNVEWNSKLQKRRRFEQKENIFRTFLSIEKCLLREMNYVLPGWQDDQVNPDWWGLNVSRLSQKSKTRFGLRLIHSRTQDWTKLRKERVIAHAQLFGQIR